MICTTLIPIENDDQILWVPCGKCIACLTNKRNDWSFRLMQEHKASKGALFITLTYSDRYLPDDGVNKKHVQLFMKRLRKKFTNKLRYYAVAEYGEKTGRPHYHLLLFNLDYGREEQAIRSAWSTKDGVPYGNVHIGKVTEASIRYCTKYVIQRGAHNFDKTNPPFALMSRAYGLGAAYLTDDMMRWHWNAKTHWLSTPRYSRNYTFIYGVKGRLPRYYKEKIWPLKEVRRMISNKSAAEAKQEHKKNLLYLIKRGYPEPMKILTEMRNAVMSRVKEKVAFTQTI